MMRSKEPRVFCEVTMVCSLDCLMLFVQTQSLVVQFEQGLTIVE